MSLSDRVKGEQTVELMRRDSAVEDARRLAELAVSYCSPECREAVSLAVCELGENVLKYGAPGPDPRAGTIGVSVVADVIRIRAVNRVGSREDAQRVQELVQRMSKEGTDIRDLYRSRLLELFSNPSLRRAQLGLMRTVFEGGFRLSCNLHGPEIEIVAERGCREGA